MKTCLNFINSIVPGKKIFLIKNVYYLADFYINFRSNSCDLLATAALMDSLPLSTVSSSSYPSPLFPMQVTNTEENSGSTACSVLVFPHFSGFFTLK